MSEWIEHDLTRGVAETMSAQNIRALKNHHAGQTIFIVASGASMDYVDSRWLNGHVVVTVNEACRDYRPFKSTTVDACVFGACFYALMHHREHAQEAINAGCVVVTSEHDCGFSSWPAANFTGDYYTYRTAENNLSVPPTVNMGALERDADDELIISPSTVAEAIHFAYHLGASTIILCGVDGAALDGRWCYKGYNDGAQTNPQHVRLTWPILMQVVNAIRARGVNVYRLDPFIGHDREGHVYTPAPVLTGSRLMKALDTVNQQEP